MQIAISHKDLDLFASIFHCKQLDDPDYAQEMHSNMGEHTGILRCSEILHELIDGEVDDRKQYTLESK